MKFFTTKRKNFIVFLALVIFLLPIIPSVTSYAATSHKNTYLGVYFDEQMCTYRYKMVTSSKELEYSRVTSLFPEKYLLRGNDSPKWYIHGLSVVNKEGNKRELVSRVTIEDSGYVSVSATKDGKAIKDFDKVKKMGETECLPLTFPSLGDEWVEADEVRCQDVIDVLGKDFNDALLYINDGNPYTDQDYFHKMALALISTNEGGVITNGYGHKYKVSWGEEAMLHGYTKNVTISMLNKAGTVDDTVSYVYSIKKGYKDCEIGELMENNRRNNISFGADDTEVVDTTWITWEHLYLEAEILYSEGISWRNANDLYVEPSVFDDFMKKFINLMAHGMGTLSVRSALELVYNAGIYGSDNYVFGIYKAGVNNVVFTVFLAFAAIMISLLSISIIRMINEHQSIATYSSMNRANLLAEGKNMLFCLFAISFSWQIFKLLFMLNFYFVEIWYAFIADNHTVLYTIGQGNITILVDIALWVVYMYIDIMYMLRSIFVPILMACSPVFIYLYTFGGNFQKITMAWLKELLGAIFMQSIHAFVITFVLMVSSDTRGLAQVIVWASIIPLTKMFRDMCGLGGKELFNAAKNLGNSAVQTAGAGADVAGSIAGAGLGVAGGVAGAIGGAKIDALRAGAGVSTNWSNKLSNFGSSFGQNTGRIGGNLAQASLGMGGVIASGGEFGGNELSAGVRGIGNNIGGIGSSLGKTVSSFGQKMSMKDYGTMKVGQMEKARMSAKGSGLSGSSGIDGQHPTASYGGDSILQSAMPEMNIEPYFDGKGGITGGRAEAKWNTDSTATRLNERFKENNLSTKSYKDLVSKADIYSKLSHDVGQYEALKKSGGKGMSKQQINQIYDNYKGACDHVGVQSLSLKKVSEQVGSGKDRKEIEQLSIVGAGDITFGKSKN